jgi:hypothetical protein
VHLDQPYPVRQTVPSIRAPRGLTSDRASKSGITVERSVTGLETCQVTVRDGKRVLYDEGLGFLGVDTTLNICRAVTVTRSEALDVVSLRMQETDRTADWDDTRHRVWLSGVGHRDLPLAAIASKVSAPKGWRVGSAAGLVVGLLSLLASLAWLAALRRLGRFALAHHDGGGKLVLGDDSVVQVDDAAALEPGDVFVKGVAPPTREPAYRAPALQKSVTLQVRSAIDVDRERERLGARVMFASALAFAFPLATAALMVAARVFGLGS